MHNVNTDAVRQTAAAAAADPSSLRQQVRFEGSWQGREGAPQFVAQIPLPDGSSVPFAADFPPPMGGRGQAPNPLAYCFWGGLACYAMSFAQEAALAGVELRSLHAVVTTDFNMAYALGVGEAPPVQQLDWELIVEADARPEQLEQLKAAADAHCPGAYCIRNPIDLRTSLTAA